MASVQVRSLGTSTPVDLLAEYNPTGDTELDIAMHKTAVLVCIIQILAAYFCYIFGA